SVVLPTANAGSARRHPRATVDAIFRELSATVSCHREVRGLARLDRRRLSSTRRISGAHMRNFIILLAILIAPVTASAQVAAPAVPPPVILAPPPPPAPPATASLSLRGEPIYVYSFLDIRKAEFGDKVLAQFHSQLIDALKASEVNPQILLFADTMQGSLFVPVRKAFNGQKTYDAAGPSDHPR